MFEDSGQDRLEEALLSRKSHFWKTQSSARAMSLLQMSAGSRHNHCHQTSCVLSQAESPLPPWTLAFKEMDSQPRGQTGSREKNQVPEKSIRSLTLVTVGERVVSWKTVWGKTTSQHREVTGHAQPERNDLQVVQIDSITS